MYHECRILNHSYNFSFVECRSDFHLGHLMINHETTSKVVLLVGASEAVIRLDLYEASENDRKTELQHLILWMSDNITTLTDKIKGTYY